MGSSSEEGGLFCFFCLKKCICVFPFPANAPNAWADDMTVLMTKAPPTEKN
jgi:hypothetical protein